MAKLQLLIYLLETISEIYLEKCDETMLDLPAPYDLIFENDSRCRLFEMLNWDVVLQTLVTKVFHVSQRQKCPTNVVGCFQKVQRSLL